MFQKNFLKIEKTTSKSFSYSKGNVNLSFTLRVDVKQDLKDFFECLKVAIKEVNEEIEK